MKKIETTVSRTMLNYKEVFTSKEDLQWLREVHVPDLPIKTKAAILSGNEDCPSWVQAFDKNSVYANLIGTWVNED